MSTCPSQTGRAPLLAVTVPPLWAWAVGVRNTAVLNVDAAPPVGPGAFLAVCAGEGHEAALADWVATWCAVQSPPADELPTCAVVAVGRLAVVSRYPDAPRASPWYAGLVGLWLEDVVPLPEAVACVPEVGGTYWQLPEPVRAQVRESYGAVLRERAQAWAAYEARAAAARARPPALGLKQRVLKLCGCRRAMAPCPSCKAWRCTNPTCPPHACTTQEARQP